MFDQSDSVFAAVHPQHAVWHKTNNLQLIQSAKWKFKGMFHGIHHPFYAGIEIHDSLMRRSIEIEISAKFPVKKVGVPVKELQPTSHASGFLKNGINHDLCR